MELLNNFSGMASIISIFCGVWFLLRNMDGVRRDIKGDMDHLENGLRNGMNNLEERLKGDMNHLEKNLTQKIEASK